MTHLKESPEQTSSGMDIPDAAIERIARAMAQGLLWAKENSKK